MKKLILVVLAYLLLSEVQAQQPYYYSQYFKVAPAFNPAFTGVDDYLDIRLIHRSQWGAYEGSPTTDYIGIYKGFRKHRELSIREFSLRISNPDVYDSILGVSARKLQRKSKHGIGGFINLDRYGPFDQLKGNINYGYHFNIRNNSYLSFGISVGIANDKLNFDKIHLAEENDAFLKELQTQGGNKTSVTVTPGILFHTPAFYIGYSAGNVVESQIESIELDEEFSSVAHYAMAGYQFPVSEKLALQLSAFGYYFNEFNNNVDVNLKVDFNRKGYAGVSYRKNNDIIAMAGFTLQNKFQFGYSYDMKVSGMNNFNNNTHELTLGFLLFNHDLNAPYTW